MDTGLDRPNMLKYGGRTPIIVDNMDRAPNETERFEAKPSRLSKIFLSPITVVLSGLVAAGAGLYLGIAPGRNITALEDGSTIMPATVAYTNAPTYTNSPSYLFQTNEFDARLERAALDAEKMASEYNDSLYTNNRPAPLVFPQSLPLRLRLHAPIKTGETQ